MAAPASTTTISCTPSKVDVNQPTSCSTTVTDTSANPTTPTGTITFASNGPGAFSVASCPLSGTGATASCSVTYTPTAIGAQTITGSYGGDSAHTTSSGTANINPTNTSTSVSCTPSTIASGQSTTCAATVTDTSSTPTTPTGIVTLNAGNGTFTGAPCTLAGTGATGSCSVNYTLKPIAARTDIVTGTYAGDVAHSGSSGSFSLTVTTGAPTATTLSCNPSTVPIGQTTTCTASVTDTSGTPTTPTGTVTFTSSGAGTFNAMNCTISGTGATASCLASYTPTAAGVQTITGSYSGDSSHSTSSNAVNVNPGNSTSTTLSCTPSTIPSGQTITCTATVTDTSATPTTPSGIVTISGGNGTFTPPPCTLAGTGTTASCSSIFAPNTSGTATINAFYLGDSAHASSYTTTAATVTIVAHPTTTTISCTNPVFVYQGSTCTVTVTDTSTTGPTTPVRTVTFAVTGVTGNFTTCTLAAGQTAGTATCLSTFTPSTAGTASIVGSYNGDPSHGPSSGTATVTTSFQPGISLTNTPSATSSGSGWSVTYTYGVCNTGNTPLNVSITDNVLGSIASGVNLSGGACNNYTMTTLLTTSTTNTATANGFDTSSGALVATATATATFTATTISSTAPTVVDQTPSTGVNTTITGSPAGASVSVTSTDLSNTQPGGTGQIGLGLTPTQFFDVHVSGVNTGSATVCITNSAVTAGTTLQYWDPTANGGAGSWVNAANVTISGNQICGDIPVSFLNGTPVALVKPTPTGPDNTKTVVTCNLSSLAVNQPTQCTATVTDTSSPTSQPTGTASFSLTPSTGRLYCTLTSGKCTVTLTPTPGSEGTQVATGAYIGDSTHKGSSSTFNLAVTNRSTSTSVNCSPNFVLPAHPTTCQAIVTDTSPGTLLTPTGTVIWSSNGAGTFSPTTCVLSATATCAVTYTPSSTAKAGNQQVNAAYQGNTDHIGSSSASTSLAIGIPPKSAVTDASFCSFDTDSSIYGQQFVLIYPQDQNTPSTYDLVASFPGQFAYNVFYHGTAGSTVSLQIRVPYPFVTQGTSPVQVWGSVGFTSQGCFSPSNKLKGFTTSITSITLSNYNPQAMSSFATLTLTGKVPSTGLVYLTVQLSYGLKPTTGYTNNNNNAINSNSPSKNVPQLQSYTFSFNTVTGDTTQSDSQIVKSENAFFTCIPGFCGIVTNSQGTPVQGVKVQIYYGTSTTQLLATVYTNQYGFYYYPYTLTGTTTAKFTILLPT